MHFSKCLSGTLPIALLLVALTLTVGFIFYNGPTEKRPFKGDLK